MELKKDMKMKKEGKKGIFKFNIRWDIRRKNWKK